MTAAMIPAPKFRTQSRAMHMGYNWYITTRTFIDGINRWDYQIKRELEDHSVVYKNVIEAELTKGPVGEK